MTDETSARFKVVVLDFLKNEMGPEHEVLGDMADITALDATSADQLVGHVEDADAIIMFHTLKIERSLLKAFRKCKILVRAGVGFDNVDIQAAREFGIPVANVPDYGTEEVADAAMGLALNLVRSINFLNRKMQLGEDPWHHGIAEPIFRLRGRVCGIIGCGRIGTAFALRAKAFGFQVQFYDPYLPDGAEKAIGVGRCESLDELLRTSDLISLHCPLTDETRHMINPSTIELCKPEAFLVNTARGGVVDHQAVVSALESDKLSGAALDVLEKEPPESADPALAAWRDPTHPAHFRLILTPHAAFYSEQSLRDMRTKGAQNIRRAFLGQPLRNVVN